MNTFQKLSKLKNENNRDYTEWDYRIHQCSQRSFDYYFSFNLTLLLGFLIYIYSLFAFCYRCENLLFRILQ